MSKRVVRIGSASAALSDSALAVPQLLERGQLDYLVGDYLAEGSMGLLAMFANAQARAGFAPDFIPVPRVRQLRSQVLVFARAHFQKCHYSSANCSGAAGFSIPNA